MSNKKINILYLRDTDQVCGPGKTMINAHRTLDRDVFSLTLCVTGAGKDGKNAFCESAKKAGADVVTLKMTGFFDLPALLGLIRLIKKRRIDILQTHDAQTRRIGIVAAFLTGVSHISSLHGWIQNNRKQKLAVLLDKFLVRFSKKVIVMSEVMKAEIVSAGVPPEKVLILHNAVLLEDYPVGRSSKKVREEFRINEDEKVIAYIGRLSAEKGPDIFVQVAQSILQKDSNVKFLIVGEGPLRSDLRKRVDALGLQDRIIFAGHRTDMEQVYAAIDILAITSFTEGLPNVLLEAFAHNKPVVSTRVGGTPEIISHGTNGFLVEPGRVDGIADCLRLLLSDPALARKMGSNGRKLIEEKLSFRKRTEKLEELYQTIIRGDRPHYEHA